MEAIISYLCKIATLLVALLNLSSWCLVMVERLFLAVPRGCLRFVIVVFPDHTHFFQKEVTSMNGASQPTHCGCSSPSSKYECVTLV